MENNEMNVREEAMDSNVAETTGVSTGVAMLIGAGVTAAVFAGVKLVKKGIAAVKAKKAEKDGVDTDADFDLVEF